MRLPPAGSANGALTTFGASTNGLTEYTASNFGGVLKGDLLAASYDNKLYRMKLNSTGTAVTLKDALFSTVGSTPLDVTALGDGGPFPGTIWVGDIVNGSITVFEPNDYGAGTPTCTGADSPPWMRTPTATPTPTSWTTAPTPARPVTPARRRPRLHLEPQRPRRRQRRPA